MTLGWGSACDHCQRTVLADDDATRQQFIHHLRTAGWFVDDDTLATLCPSCAKEEPHAAGDS